jgi:hypothetical protein
MNLIAMAAPRPSTGGLHRSPDRVRTNHRLHGIRRCKNGIESHILGWFPRCRAYGFLGMRCVRGQPRTHDPAPGDRGGDGKRRHDRGSHRRTDGACSVVAARGCCRPVRSGPQHASTSSSRA